jgi:hypothetical protein
MGDVLTRAFADLPPVDSLAVLLRLIAAVVLGGAVAWVYRATQEPNDIVPSFPATLVLLSVLIAMVTQVIGDNVARAFSLVGALSIVRFRTVVRDTRDTAFVIFAVVVGMAVGAAYLAVAATGLVVTSAAAFVMRPRVVAVGYSVRLRVGLGCDIETAAGPVLDGHLSGRQLVSMSTVRQGLAVEVSYRGQLRPQGDPEALVKLLNSIEGVQQVEIFRAPAAED